MLTSNTEMLRRLEALKKQVEDTKKEIDLRIKEKRADNDGYIIAEGQSGKYSLVSKEYYIKSMVNIMNQVNKQHIMNHENKQFHDHQCKCEEGK